MDVDGVTLCLFFGCLYLCSFFSYYFRPLGPTPKTKCYSSVIGIIRDVDTNTAALDTDT